MSEIRTVCVYCASSDHCRPIFLESAYSLGNILAKESIDIVYGGGSTGLMGRLADGAIAGNGHVRGIIPQFMQNLEWGHKGISILEEVEDMVEDESTVATALKEDSRRARDYQRQLQHARTEVPTFPVIVSLHCALTY